MLRGHPPSVKSGRVQNPLSMAQEASKMYDLLYIVPNKYTENEVPQVMKTVNDLIVKMNGKVVKEINYGKRRLAYPVKHNHYGYYILDRFEALAADTQALNTTLRVQDEVLRHLITVSMKEGDVPQEADLKQVELPPQPAAEKPSRKRPSIVDVEASGAEKEKLKKGSTFDIEKELGVTATEAEASMAQEAKKEETKSVDIKELDNKLDEIMKDFQN